MYNNPATPGVIGFVENWAIAAALQEHLQSPIVTKLFSHQYYRELISKPAMLYGPWIEIPEDRKFDEIEMVFYWTMDCSRKHVWDIITNWTDASWVHGKPTTTIVPLDENGLPMSDEDAKKKGYVDPEGGLGPIVQRRTWPNGLNVDVRMLSKDEKTFTTVQQTLSSLVFPKVVYDKFFVTLSLDAEDLDVDTQSRLRYHVRATIKSGTYDDARSTLKNDFYGPRIAFYKEYFNCSAGVLLKRAQRSAQNLHAALRAGKKADVEALFASGDVAKEYLDRLSIDGTSNGAAFVDVKLPFPLFAIPDLRVVAVEKLTATSVSGTVMRHRIMVYQMDAWGRVTSTRVLDDHAVAHKDGLGADLVAWTAQYFETLKLRDIETVRALYAADAVLVDPVSFSPPRTFHSVYNAFYGLATSFEYTRYPSRTFVDVQNRQTTQVVDAMFTLADGSGLKSHPVQIFTFNSAGKISKFEAFFVPTVIDFSHLE